jgi:hypothetical protein
MKRIAIFLLMLSIAFFSCKKKKATPPSDEKQFVFNSLKSDVSTLKQGDVTNIKADVTGSVTYAWACSSGDIFGNGNVILFGAGSCCTGGHTITCTVTDEHKNSESKSVEINVN